MDVDLDELVDKDGNVAIHSASSVILRLIADDSFTSLKDLMLKGLPKDEFVDALVRVCGQTRPEVLDAPHKERLEKLLYALFDEIDVNSNGLVDWEEFTHHVLHRAHCESETNRIHQRTGFQFAGKLPTKTLRVKHSLLEYIPAWQSYVLAETIAGTSDTGMLTVYEQHCLKDGSVDLATKAVHKLDYPIDSLVYVNSLHMLCTTTVNSRIHYITVTDDPLLREAGKLQHILWQREQHFEGRHSVMRYDEETDRIYAGGADGSISVIDASEGRFMLPKVDCIFAPHRQPVLDVVVLPEHGSKKIITAGLDGKVLVHDIGRNQALGELGDHIGAISMSYSDTYSLMVSVSTKDLDPLVWAPHAASNPFVKRLEENGSSVKRSRLIQCCCVPGTPNCITADVTGQLKLWDLRKLNMVVAFYSNADHHSEEASSVLCKRFAVDPSRLDIVSLCRGEQGGALYSFRSTHESGRNALATHDSDVIAVDYVDALKWVLTACSYSVKVWDVLTGVMLQRTTSFWNESTPEDRGGLTAMVADQNGRRFFLGTRAGTVSLHSTATSAQLCDFQGHQTAVTSLRFFPKRGLIVSLAQDGTISASLTECDPPQLVFRTSTEDYRITALSTSEFISLCVAGDVKSQVLCLDLSPGGKGIQVGRVPPVIEHLAAQRSAKAGSPEATDADLASYINPPEHETSACCICEPRPFAVTGDTRGLLYLVTVRPHPHAAIRYSKWKSFYPKATAVMFAVPLSLVWDDANSILFVGDDQGNVTMWDCTEVISKYKLDPMTFPTTSHNLMQMAMPELPPMSISPTLRGFFPVHSNVVPVVSLKLVGEHRAVIATTEKSVTLWAYSGGCLGTLMQGRGNSPGFKYDSYCFQLYGEHDLRGHESDDGEASMIAHTTPQTGSETPQTPEARQHTRSILRQFMEFNRFVFLSQGEYDEVMASDAGSAGCADLGVRRRSQAPSQEQTLSIPIPETPPGTPKKIRKPHADLSLPLPKGMVDKDSVRVVERLTKPPHELETAYSPIRRKERSALASAAAIAAALDDDVNQSVPEAAAAKLRALVDEGAAKFKEPLPKDPVTMFWREPASRLNHPSLASAFLVDDYSSQIDWKASAARNPSKSASVNNIIASFSEGVFEACIAEDASPRAARPRRSTASSTVTPRIISPRKCESVSPLAPNLCLTQPSCRSSMQAREVSRTAVTPQQISLSQTALGQSANSVLWQGCISTKKAKRLALRSASSLASSLQLSATSNSNNNSSGLNPSSLARAQLMYKDAPPLQRSMTVDINDPKAAQLLCIPRAATADPTRERYRQRQVAHNIERSEMTPLALPRDDHPFGTSAILPRKAPEWIAKREATPTQSRKLRQQAVIQQSRGAAVVGQSMSPVPLDTSTHKERATSAMLPGFRSRKDYIQFVIHFPRLRQMLITAEADAAERITQATLRSVTPATISNAPIGKRPA